MKKLSRDPDAPMGFIGKEAYRDRRSKGYRGQVPVPGTKHFDYEQRRAFRLMRAEGFKKLKGDHETTKRKDVPKAI